jgi:hypothetical protein
MAKSRKSAKMIPKRVFKVFLVMIHTTILCLPFGSSEPSLKRSEEQNEGRHSYIYGINSLTF